MAVLGASVLSSGAAIGQSADLVKSITFVDVAGSMGIDTTHVNNTDEAPSPPVIGTGAG
jgi:hypothetical protein